MKIPQIDSTETQDMLPQHPFAVSTHWSIKNTRNKNSAEMPATVKKARKVRTFVVELADEAEALATDPEAAMPPRCEAPVGAGLGTRSRRLIT